MKVLKFGGTSVGTAESLRNVEKIILGNTEPIVVVVSALGGLTDKLLATAAKAASGDESYKADVESIRQRHYDIVEAVVKDPERKRDCLEKITPLLDELERTYMGVNLLQYLNTPISDKIVSFGERISSIIVAAMIPTSTHLDSLEIFKTENRFGKNIVVNALTIANIREAAHPEAGKPIIAGGFISKDLNSGAITNLGRGGSDFTAALFAAALDADVLEIWTDVDGFLTSDPRIIPEARLIPEMSFVESLELCTFGAKVVYPPTIYPVFQKNIPIKILNTHNPEAPGTMIKDFDNKLLKNCSHVRGLSALKDVHLIQIKTGDEAVNNTVSSRIFNALALNGINVFLTVKLDEHDGFTIALRKDECEAALTLIRKEFAPEISAGKISAVDCIEGLTMIALVGENILGHGEISPRIIHTLQREEIPTLAVSEGASRTTVTITVPEAHTNRSLQLIHSLFYS